MNRFPIVSAAVTAILLCAAPSVAQLRPLEPVAFDAFSGPAVHFDIGVGSYSDQRASLAGVRGRLWEAGNFHMTIRTGRMIMELGGTLQRLFRESEVYAAPFGDATSSTSGKRHDSGDYRVGAVLQLTPGQSPTLATLRFGTRLPTTDNRVGLDRDATDFFATVGARRTFGSFALSTEAGLSINGTRKPTYEQSDVLVYALTGELLLRGVTPYLVALGQEDLHNRVAVRGNEDLGELRIGARAGGRRWIKAAFVKGYHEYSPSSGFQLSAGITLGKP